MTNANPSSPQPLGVSWNGFRALLAAPVDAASLAMFRICFGLVMLYEAFHFLVPQGSKNRIEQLFSHNHWHFPYHGFEWVKPWPETGMHIHFWVLGIVAAMVTLGLFYRVAAALMFLAFTYIFLLDAALYLNHFYLMCLLCFLLIWLPANRCWSVDAWWKRHRQNTPDPFVGPPFVGPGGALIPSWPVFLLRVQLFIVYFYAGVAKINADWLSGEALVPAHQKVFDFFSSHWLLPAWVQVKHVGIWMNWSGLVFDLSIGFLLICRRTRLLGILLMLMFHTINHFIFPIAVFPVMAFFASLIFCEPDWPRRVWAWIRKPRFAKPDWRWLLGGSLALPLLGAALGWKQKMYTQPTNKPAGKVRGWAFGFVSVWVVAQCLIPLRHFWIDGNPEWTEEQQRFSWRMMLKSKVAVDVKLDLQDPAILDADKNGFPQVHWENWPKSLPPAMHVAVDAHLVPWNQLPDMVFIYEPCNGIRVIDNPLALNKAQGATIEERREKVREQWMKTYGRSPRIHTAISLKEALTTLRDKFAELAARDGSGAELLNTHISAIDRILEIQKSRKRTVAEMIEFSDLLQLMTDSKHGELVRRHLVRTQPFAVQGVREGNHNFLVIEDPQLDQDRLPMVLDRLNAGKPYTVLVDTSRLRYEGWRHLPKALLLVEAGPPRLVWNCFSELHQRQIENMTKHPFMAHQYANRVAGLWEQETGRRPAVHALAVAKLNQHKPQLLIDPSVDLASTSINLIGHNPWIYQLDSFAAQVPPTGIAETKPAVGDSKTGQPACESLCREILERYPSGQPKEGIQWNASKHDYRIVKWHENGQIAMLAQYQHDQPNGKQMKWDSTGILILEMHFKNGKPHGTATSWNADGKLVEKAEFFEGKQVSYDSDSKPSTTATTKRIGPTSKKSSQR